MLRAPISRALQASRRVANAPAAESVGKAIAASWIPDKKGYAGDFGVSSILVLAALTATGLGEQGGSKGAARPCRASLSV